MGVRDAGYISRMLVEVSNHHSGSTSELMEGAASEIDLLLDEKADLRDEVERLTGQVQNMRETCTLLASWHSLRGEVERLTALSDELRQERDECLDLATKMRFDRDKLKVAMQRVEQIAAEAARP